MDVCLSVSPMDSVRGRSESGVGEGIWGNGCHPWEGGVCARRRAGHRTPVVLCGRWMCLWVGERVYVCFWLDVGSWMFVWLLHAFLCELFVCMLVVRMCVCVCVRAHS